MFQANNKIDQTDRRHHEALQGESRQREAGDEQIRKQLEEAVAGGLHLELTGVLWIALGIILATASNEISKLPLFAACP